MIEILNHGRVLFVSEEGDKKDQEEEEEEDKVVVGGVTGINSKNCG